MADSPPSPAGRLLVVGGPPAAGKTTRARELAGERDAMRLAPDDWLGALDLDVRDSAARDRVEALQWELARSLLGRGIVVVLDWGVFTRAKREVLRAGARELGAGVELHFLEEPRNVLRSRLAERAAAGDETAPSENELDALLGELEPPDAAERALYDAPQGPVSHPG